MLDLLLEVYERGQVLLILLEQHETFWQRNARTSQKEPAGDWLVWLVLAGRGFGKTRTGSETIRSWALSGRYQRIAIIGRTLTEANEIMIDGESGLLNIHPSWQKPKKSKDCLIWENGAKAFVMSGHNPERFRGPQFDAAWVDELAKFKHPEEFFMQLRLCLRLGKNPKCIITTTPKPLAFLEKLISDPLTHLTRGTTFENEANLSKGFSEHLQKTLSQSMVAQELHGELLTEREGALWTRSMIRYKSVSKELFCRVVIAIDPATTHNNQSDETGIIVAGLTLEDEIIVLEDLSGRHSPSAWGQKVVEAYHHFHADRIVAEVNKGGDLVERILTSLNPYISYRAVRATRGKVTRAEPVAALYEREKIFHLRPFRNLELQLCTYTQNTKTTSPDRLDALVWAVTDLMLSKVDVNAWVI